MQVLVGLNESFEVADHDFSRGSITPSVVLDVSTPEKAEESFYDGKVRVILKDAVFQVHFIACMLFSKVNSTNHIHLISCFNTTCGRELEPYQV